MEDKIHDHHQPGERTQASPAKSHGHYRHFVCKHAPLLRASHLGVARSFSTPPLHYERDAISITDVVYAKQCALPRKTSFLLQFKCPVGVSDISPKEQQQQQKKKRNKGRRRLNCLVISKPRREIETDEEEKKCRGRSGDKFGFFEVESNCARGITSTLSFK